MSPIHVIGGGLAGLAGILEAAGPFAACVKPQIAAKATAMYSRL